MKTKYIATSAFWHRNVLVEVNAPIRLTEAESRYLGHAIATPEQLEAARATLAAVIASKPGAEPAPEPKKPARRRKRVDADGDLG